MPGTKSDGFRVLFMGIFISRGMEWNIGCHLWHSPNPFEVICGEFRNFWTDARSCAMVCPASCDSDGAGAHIVPRAFEWQISLGP
jgi:hypothetical protein